MCEIKGTIKVIRDEQIVSDKFKKREFVVSTPDEYPQHISIEMTQDKTSLLDKFAVGQEVIVSVNVRGREWTNPKTNEVKYFNTLQGWKISGSEQNAPKSAENAPSQNSGDDGLPF